MKFIKLLIPVLFSVSVVACAQTNTSTSKPDRWEETIQGFEASDKANPPEENPILFVGSSSIVMYKDLEEHFPGHNVLNRGFGGSQFSDLLQYDDRVIYPYKPSKIFIYEGDNDIGSGDKPKDVLKEAKELRERIAENLPGVPVVFIAAKPSVRRWEMKEKYEDLNKRLKKYADKEPLTMFADVWSAMLDENGQVYDHIFIEDNLHMNAEGYKIWQSVLAPYLEEGKTD